MVFSIFPLDRHQMLWYVRNMELEPNDLELIKKGKKNNPTWVKTGNKAIKWIYCPKYIDCLNKADHYGVTNWSCINCQDAAQAKLKELVILRAKHTLNKAELEEIEKFEKINNIHTSISDSQVY